MCVGNAAVFVCVVNVNLEFDYVLLCCYACHWVHRVADSTYCIPCMCAHYELVPVSVVAYDDGPMLLGRVYMYMIVHNYIMARST